MDELTVTLSLKELEELLDYKSRIKAVQRCVDSDGYLSETLIKTILGIKKTGEDE